MSTEERYRIEGGDGNRAFFGEKRVLRPVQADWFPGKIGQWYGDALLFVTEGGEHNGEYIALTPRTTGSLSEQFALNAWASVIVHRITNPTASFTGKDSDAVPVGMAFVQSLTRPPSSDWTRLAEKLRDAGLLPLSPNEDASGPKD